MAPRAAITACLCMPLAAVLQGVDAERAVRCGGLQDCEGTAQESVLLQSKVSLHGELQEAPDSEEQEEEDYWMLEAPDSVEQEEEEDWMLELTLDHEWLAGGDSSDAAFANLSVEEKATFVDAMHKKADEICEEDEEAVQERNVWIKRFKSIHQKAVHYLKSHRGGFIPKDAHASRRHKGAGEIAGLYTFGAPGTALHPLSNPLSTDGKFPGLRVITQRLEKVRGIYRRFHDPVSFFGGLVGLKHPHMDLLLLSVNQTPWVQNASRSTSRFPRSDMAFWLDGHSQETYADTWLPHKERFDPKAYEMLFLSRAVNPNINKHKIELVAQEAQKVGWNLVAQSRSEAWNMADFVVLDNTSLFQHPETLACTLAFTPTHDATQWLANLKVRGSTFCGIPYVHRGFRNQLRRAMLASGWAAQILPALTACKELYVAGHSLGAGQAQLAAACLQRAPAEDEVGWSDYKRLAWTPGTNTPRRLPALV